MNTQEAFEYSVTHMAAQGGPSIGNSGCVYRGPDNKKCGVGWLIPDNLYRKEFEREALEILIQKLSDTFKDIDPQFIRSLQIAHDDFRTCYGARSVWGQNFKRRFEVLGKKYKLNTKFLEKLEIIGEEW